MLDEQLNIKVMLIMYCSSYPWNHVHGCNSGDKVMVKITNIFFAVILAIPAKSISICYRQCYRMYVAISVTKILW